MNSHLVKEEFSTLLFPQVHLLHGDQFPCGLHRGDTHDPRGPLPDLDVVVQVGPRITRIYYHLERGPELLMGNSLRLPLWGAGLGRSAGRRGPRGRRRPRGGNAGVRGVWMLGGFRGQAGVGSVMRVAQRGLGAGGTFVGAARGAVLRGGFMVSNRLERGETEERQQQKIINPKEAIFSGLELQYIFY